MPSSSVQDHQSKVPARPRRVTPFKGMFPLFAGLLALGDLGGAMAASQAPISRDIYGRYAPDGNCKSAPRVRVDSKGVFVYVKGHQTGPLPISACTSCAGGAPSDGIQKWIYVKHGKTSEGDNLPVVLKFNAQEERGQLQVELDESSKTLLSPAMSALVKLGSLQRCS